MIQEKGKTSRRPNYLDALRACFEQKSNSKLYYCSLREHMTVVDSRNLKFRQKCHQRHDKRMPNSSLLCWRDGAGSSLWNICEMCMETKMWYASLGFNWHWNATDRFSPYLQHTRNSPNVTKVRKTIGKDALMAFSCLKRGSKIIRNSGIRLAELLALFGAYI